MTSWLPGGPYNRTVNFRQDGNPGVAADTCTPSHRDWRFVTRRDSQVRFYRTYSSDLKRHLLIEGRVTRCREIYSSNRCGIRGTVRKLVTAEDDRAFGPTADGSGYTALQGSAARKPTALPSANWWATVDSCRCDPGWLRRPALERVVGSSSNSCRPDGGTAALCRCCSPPR